MRWAQNTCERHRLTEQQRALPQQDPRNRQPLHKGELLEIVARGEWARHVLSRRKDADLQRERVGIGLRLEGEARLDGLCVEDERTKWRSWRGVGWRKTGPRRMRRITRYLAITNLATP